MGRASAAISKAKREAFLDRVASDASPQPDHRLCVDCREFLPLARFGLRKQKTKAGPISVIPRSVCKCCEAQRSRSYKERKIAEGTWKEIRKPSQERFRKTEKAREYQREWKVAKRRKLGVKPREVKRPAPSHWTEGLPIGPIREFLELEIEKGRGVSTIEAATGVDHRRISGILKEEYATVTLHVIDKLLVGLGCPEELHFLYPAEEEQITGYAYLKAAA